jgi:hypothetical protein
MKIIKIAGRKIRAVLIGGPNGQKLHLLPDQGLGESCHQILDISLKGVASGGRSWDDPPEKEELPQQQQQMARR